MSNAEKTEKSEKSIETILRIIRNRGGYLRMAEAIRMGLNRYTLYSLLDKGILEQVSRGIYRLAELSPIAAQDFVTVALRAPRSVICLVSALAFHELTTVIPHEVSIAIRRGSEAPRIQHPPIAVYRFSGAAFESGIEKYEMDGATVRIYSAEKTLADCFKFRNKLGMDVVLEALKRYKARRSFKVDELVEFARVCRVESVMKPYLESLM